MTLSIILFFIGFFILIKGASWLTDGAASIASKLKISQFVIGLVIVGIGTSIPEFSTAFFAHIIGEEDIGLGTVIGSNTFNILFILGVSALFFFLPFKRTWVRNDLAWNFAAIAAVWFFVLFPFARGEKDYVISQGEGLVILLVFIYWLFYSLALERDGEEFIKEARIFTVPLTFIMIGAGLLGVIVGGKWVVDGAKVIAADLGMSEGLIGLTIVGIGTSLPELAVTFVAAWKKKIGIAVGNIIGSNIFDFLMILGFSAIVKPILFPQKLMVDMGVTFLAAVLLFSAMFVGERYRLTRWQGLLFTLLYIGYVIYAAARG